MKKYLLKILIAFISFGLSLISLFIPEPVRNYCVLFSVPLFFSVFTGVFCGPFYGFFVGSLAKLIAVAFLPEESFDLQIIQQLLALAVSGTVSGWIYRILRSGIAASVLGILAGRIILGFTGLIVSFFAYRSYSLTDYLKEAFINVWAGLAAIVVIIPILVYFGRKINIFRILGDRVGYWY